MHINTVAMLAPTMVKHSYPASVRMSIKTNKGAEDLYDAVNSAAHRIGTVLRQVHAKATVLVQLTETDEHLERTVACLLCWSSAGQSGPVGGHPACRAIKLRRAPAVTPAERRVPAARQHRRERHSCPAAAPTFWAASPLTAWPPARWPAAPPHLHAGTRP